MNIFMERESDEEGDESAEDGGGDGDSAELRHVARAAAAPRRSASRALRHILFFAAPSRFVQPRASLCRHASYFLQGRTLVAMSQLVQRCSPTTGRMPRSILGLTAGALSGWAVWRISSMRTHTTL